MKKTLKRLALLITLALLLAVDYFAAEYYRPVKGWTMRLPKG